MKFSKYNSTGNDFILVSSDEVESISARIVKSLCHRQWGIGADGFIIVMKLNDSSVRMQYFNADGNEVEMCGNGLRATAIFAQEKLKINPSNHLIKVQSKNSEYNVEINSLVGIKIEMAEIGKVDEIDVSKYNASFLRVGVPHVVVEKSNLREFPVDQALEIRHDPIFSEGTNINFFHETSPGEIRVRTFERGVEAETLSCGTGVTACGYLYLLKNADTNEVKVQTEGGQLIVQRQAEKIYLSGPSFCVFDGVLSSHYLPREN